MSIKIDLVNEKEYVLGTLLSDDAFVYNNDLYIPVSGTSTGTEVKCFNMHSRSIHTLSLKEKVIKKDIKITVKSIKEKDD